MFSGHVFPNFMAILWPYGLINTFIYKCINRHIYL